MSPPRSTIAWRSSRVAPASPTPPRTNETVPPTAGTRKTKIATRTHPPPKTPSQAASTTTTSAGGATLTNSKQGPLEAGKTSLLDILATRTTIGVVPGDVFVIESLRDTSFQRKTGYAQQFDLHLATHTVREALQFSALTRQPWAISRKEKLQHVEEVIKLLGMEGYAEAVVGVPGEEGKP